jgi:hypothetical protein
MAQGSKGTCGQCRGVMARAMVQLNCRNHGGDAIECAVGEDIGGGGGETRWVGPLETTVSDQWAC